MTLCSCGSDVFLFSFHDMNGRVGVGAAHCGQVCRMSWRYRVQLGNDVGEFTNCYKNVTIRLECLMI